MVRLRLMLVRSKGRWFCVLRFTSDRSESNAKGRYLKINYFDLHSDVLKQRDQIGTLYTQCGLCYY